MKLSINEALTVFFVLCYNLILIAGTVYLVVELDWSPWWFLLTILFMANKYKWDDNDKSSNQS